MSMTAMQTISGEIQSQPLNDNFSLIAQDVTIHLADYVRQPDWGTTTGSANTYVVSTTPAPGSLVDGMSIYLDINVANTGASTLNWNALGAKAIVNGNGNALTAGMLPLNSIRGVRYNASASNFQLLDATHDTLTLLWSGNTTTLENITLNSSCTGLYDAFIVQSGAAATTMYYYTENPAMKFPLYHNTMALNYQTFTGAGRLLGVDASGLYLNFDTTGGQPLRSIYGIIRRTRA